MPKPSVPVTRCAAMSVVGVFELLCETSEGLAPVVSEFPGFLHRLNYASVVGLLVGRCIVLIDRQPPARATFTAGRCCARWPTSAGVGEAVMRKARQAGERLRLAEPLADALFVHRRGAPAECDHA
jgi:hypothetical protein